MRHSSIFGRVSRAIAGSSLSAALLLFAGLGFSTQAHAALGVSMTTAPGAPNPINPGDTTTFRIILTNSSTAADVTGVGFTDTMDARLFVVDPVAVKSCTDGNGGAVASTATVTAPLNGQVITVSGETVPAAVGGISGVCTIDVKVTSVANNQAPVNTIAVGAVTGTEGVTPVSNGTAAQQSITVNNLSAPVISKSFSPSTIVRSDQATTLSIVIANLNTGATMPLSDVADAGGFAIRDNLPAGMQVAPTPNASVSCPGTGASNPTFVPVANATTVTAFGGIVAANNSCTLKVDVVATSTGGAYSTGFTNTISKTTDFFDKRGLVPTADATAALTVNSLLRVTKSFDNDPVRAGQPTTMTIKLINAGSSTALSGISFTDSPMDGVTGARLLVTGAATITSCGGAPSVVPTAGNAGIAASGLSVAAGATCTIVVPYTATLAVPGVPQTFTNTIAEGSITVTSDPSIKNQPASVTVTVVDQVTVVKTASPLIVGPGNGVKYTLTVNNFSPSALDGLKVPDQLPTGLLAMATLPAAPQITGGACTGLTSDLAVPNRPVFTITSFPPTTSALASTCTITFWAMVPTTATNSVALSNVIAAGDVKIGAGPGLNHDASNTVTSTTSTAVVALSKTFSPASAYEGTVSVLKIKITNITGANFTASTLTDNLPLANSPGTGQMVIASPADASTTCAGATLSATPGGTQIKLTNATIPGRPGNGTGPDGFCEIQVKIIAPPGNYDNQLPPNAFIGTQTYSDNTTAPISNIGTVTASMVYNSALVPAKSFLPAVITPGGKSTVRVNLTNLGTAAALTNVTVTDPLPANMKVATPPNAYTTCGGTPAIVAVADALTASVSGLIVPPAGACDFLFDVTGSGTLGWTNTIPAGNVTAANGVRNITAISAVLANSNSGGLNVTNGTTPATLSAPGQVSVLKVTITNNGTLDLSNVSLNNYFTANGLAGGAMTGMQVAAVPGLSTTCPGGIVTSAADGSSVSLTNATLAHGASCDIFANITLTTANTVQDLIPIGAVKTAEGISNTTSTVSSLNAGGNIGVTKSFTPSVIPPNGRSRLRLTFINPVAISLAGLTAFDDFLATGLKIATSPNAVTTCTGASVTAVSGATTVQLSNGSLPAAVSGVSSTCYLEIDVTAAAAGSYPNTINAHDVDGTIGGGPVDNPVPATATLQVRTPVVIGKTFNPTSVQPSVPSVVTITLTNNNTIPLTGATFVDNLPANLVVAQTPGGAMVCAGGTAGAVTAVVSATKVTVAGATIAANGLCTVTFNVVSNIAATYTNTIPVGGLTTVEGVTNDTPATATLSLLDPPTVAKQFVPVSIPANGTSTLTIVLGNTNATPVTLTSALVDTLPTVPGNIVVAAAPNITSSTCTQSAIVATAGGATVTYNNGAVIPAGGCTIVVDVTGSVVGNYNNFIPAGDLKTNTGNNPQPATANLTISPLGSISGRVFKDNSVVPNGLFDAVDVGIANVAIHLQGTETVGGAIISVDAITDALGNYAFTGLNAGTYTVSEPTQPVGTVNGITSAGPVTLPAGTSGTPSAVATTPSTIANIVLAKDVANKVSVSPNNNFAEVVRSSIAGNVFLDQDNSGTKDTADTPLASVTIELLKGAAVVATTTTDATGAYVFPNLDPGTYTVREPTQPANTVNGKTLPGVVGNGGTAGTATIPTVTPSLISGIILPPGTASTANNFAELPSGRQISGRVYGDADTDGTFDNADTGLAGVVLNLTGTDVNGQPVMATATTGPDGRYVFSGLVEGTYTVTEPTQPARTTDGTTNVGSTGGTATPLGTTPSRISNIPMAAATISSTDNNFGELLIPTGTVSGKVYIDTNNNGIIDAGELGVNTVPGVSITLSGTRADNVTPFSATLLTLADGSYSFLNVPPSNTAGYTITEIQPAFYKDGKTTIAPGNPGVVASSKPVSANNTDVIRGVVVIAGDVLPNYNFGEIPAVGLGLIPPIVNGYVYLDKDHNHVRDNNGTSIGQAGWTVVLTNPTTLPALSCTTTTDANGFYQFDNLHCPGYEATGLPISAGYKITFSKDGGSLTATPTSGGLRGQIPSGGSVIDNITLAAADQVVEQNLPLDPSGVIYDSSSRTPVAGAVIHITGPGGITINPANLVGGHDTQTVGSDGFYQFLLQDDIVAGAFPNGTYTLTVTAPGGYQPAPSAVLPVCIGTLPIGAVPNPALIQSSNLAPGQSVPQPASVAACPGLVGGGSNTTQYYFSFVIDHTSANILNNHIPLDPMSASQILVSKTTPLVNVSRGDLVPYTITATNTLASPLANVAVRDQIPPGFKYRVGSASLNGVGSEPTVSGRILTWPAQTFAAKEKKTYRLILQVGSGVGDGKYVNQGFAMDFATGFMLSNLATATVNVVPDPTFDCPDVIGKVFDDQNANGYQDEGEPGIPAVRLATARGLLVMTDSEGRFHVPCPEIPNPDRGSNFVMKLDTRTLPSGYRITTENPRDIRLTRGKVSKLNFGATIHRVVRLELSDSAFLPNSETLQPQWQQQLDALPDTLKLRPSVVRLNYASGSDSPDQVKKRIAAISKQIKGRWTALKGQYTLDIETEDAQ
jgi:uncharacterized repeat protein (TIGR01451 family)/fimbrial isopeptide formation D2 family protein